MYPLDGEFGCEQILDVVGTGMQEVLVAELVFFVLLEDVAAAEQVYTLVETVGLGDGPVGGYLDLQDDLEHEEPGQ